MHRSTHTQQQGGKFIASGTYGCVYAPNLPGKTVSERNSKYISKVIAEKDLANEVEEIKHLKLEVMDPSSQYFIYPTLVDTIGSFSAEEDNNFKDCFFLKDQMQTYQTMGLTPEQIAEKLSTQYKNIIQSNGGKDLHSYLYPMFAKRNALKTDQVRTILMRFWNVFKGLTLLAANRITHRDLKLANITSDPTFRIIDFGQFAISMDSDIQDEEHQDFYDTTYSVWPMDYMVHVRDIHHSSDKPEEIHKACLTLAEEYLKEEAFHRFRDQMIIDIEEYVTFLVKNKQNEYSSVSLSKLDCYSFGLILIEVADYVYRKEDASVEMQVIKKMYQLAQQMICANPIRRLTLFEASKRYLRLLKPLFFTVNEYNDELIKLMELNSPMQKGSGSGSSRKKRMLLRRQLKNLTVEQLRATLSSRKTPGRSKMNKQQMVQCLLNQTT